MPRNKYVEIRNDKPTNQKQRDWPEYKTCKFTTEAIVTEGSEKGEVRRVCANPECPVHHAKKQRSNVAAGPGVNAEQEKRRREEALAQVTGLRVLGAIVEAVPVRLMKRDLLFVVERLAAILDERRLAIVLRQHGIGKAKNPADTPAKLLTAFIRKSEESILGRLLVRKPTTATRRLSLQRLSELYALDPEVPIFRVLRKLWDPDPSSRPLLALLAALARDPLLLATAQAILPLADGLEMPRKSMAEGLRATVGERLSDSTLDKVIRNAASSWSQSGHLSGRTFKIRRRVQPTPRTVAFALYLGAAVGFHGEDLLSSGWVKALDCTPSQSLNLAIEAKRLGLLDLRVAGNVFDLSLDRLDPQSEGDAR